MIESFWATPYAVAVLGTVVMSFGFSGVPIAVGRSVNLLPAVFGTTAMGLGVALMKTFMDCANFTETLRADEHLPPIDAFLSSQWNAIVVAMWLCLPQVLLGVIAAFTMVRAKAKPKS